MKRLAIAALIACGPPPATTTPSRAPVLVAPGARLPDDSTPLAYDLRLEVDPDSDELSGAVTIRVAVHGRYVWLHASELALGATSYRSGGERHPLPVVMEQGDLRAFDLGEVITGEVELSLAYTGHTGADEEGLFRQLDRGHWYLFSQSESVLARRFVPCFDEPRFKTPWRVAVVAPAAMTVAGNGPVESTQRLADGRRETRFAETAPMASYLLAIAAGPFTVVDAGTAGTRSLPVRALVAADHADEARLVRAHVPALVARLERYLGSPLPWPKLDFVAVPHFFGAMENPGLVTIELEALTGEPDRFVKFAGHELAHHWFGDDATHRWWDDLWVSEAFAQWLADKLAGELHAYDDEVLRRALSREDALAADDAVDARPLHHAVAEGADSDNDFDAISYEKGASLLASFERVAGVDAFRTGVRTFLSAHARGTFTTADLLAAFPPAISHGLAIDVESAGPPLVELSCAGDRLVAVARHGAVPLCTRPGGCVVVETRTELGACPAGGAASVVANADGLGYYVSTGGAIGTAPGELIAHGDDVAAAVQRGELTRRAATAELEALARGDVYAQLGGLAIARALAPFEPAIGAIVAHAYAAPLGKLASSLPRPAERELRTQLLAIAELPALAPATEAVLAASLAHPTPLTALYIQLAAPTHGTRLFDRVVALANKASGQTRDALIEALGTFGPDVAPRAVERVAAGELAVTVALAYLARPATRAVAWSAIRARVDQLRALASTSQLEDLVTALAGLCDGRADVAAAFPDVAPRVLAHALASIDRCTRRRAALQP